MTDEFIPAGGTDLVLAWLEALMLPEPAHSLWAAMDDDLRLALSQGWLMGGTDVLDVLIRDELASEMANAGGEHPWWARMISDYVDRWRQVYATIDGRPALATINDPVGLDMELIVVTSDDYAGSYPEGGQIPAHCFITHLVDDEWKIAALGRRLPVPGWPPGAEKIAGLTVDGQPGQ